MENELPRQILKGVKKFKSSDIKEKIKFIIYYLFIWSFKRKNS